MTLVRLVLLVALIAAPHSVVAQNARSGLWWSVAAGAGGSRLACDVCETTRDGGPTLEAAVGAYASPAVRVGVDGGAWTFRDDDFRETVMTAGLVAELHPRPASGLHLIGGLGWSGYRANDIDAEPDDLGVSYDALRLRLGVGWDLPLLASWSVGNRLTLDASSLGTLTDQDTPLPYKVGLSVVRFVIFIRHR